MLCEPYSTSSVVVVVAAAAAAAAAIVVHSSVHPEHFTFHPQ